MKYLVVRAFQRFQEGSRIGIVPFHEQAIDLLRKIQEALPRWEARHGLDIETVEVSFPYFYSLDITDPALPSLFRSIRTAQIISSPEIPFATLAQYDRPILGFPHYVARITLPSTICWASDSYRTDEVSLSYILSHV